MSAASFEQPVLESIFLIVLAHLVKIVHVQLH